MQFTFWVISVLEFPAETTCSAPDAVVAEEVRVWLDWEVRILGPGHGGPARVFRPGEDVPVEVARHVVGVQ